MKISSFKGTFPNSGLRLLAFGTRGVARTGPGGAKSCKCKCRGQSLGSISMVPYDCY